MRLPMRAREEKEENETIQRAVEKIKVFAAQPCGNSQNSWEDYTLKEKRAVAQFKREQELAAACR